MGAQSPPNVQLVDGDGNYNLIGVESFLKAVRLAERGISYAVVAIMGPQSSGKSTLLNHLFGTRFVEMDAYRGRSQTTQGIWLSQAVDIEPCTLVCDLEGTDGRERGEDDTTFEKQSSLFALAVADVVLVNMWCHDIGREQAANKPLLKTVFQVMMRLFTVKKTTMLFVIRDKTRTPMETLEITLRNDVQKIWDSVAKPEQYANTPLSDFFNIQVTALPNFEEKEELFEEEVRKLRLRFQDSISPGRIAGNRGMVVPGTVFATSTQKIWRSIKENKDLDLPAHKVMVATVRCEELVQEKLEELLQSETWSALVEGSSAGIVTGFGRQAGAVLHNCLSRYDEEAAYFDEGVRNSKRQNLLSRAGQELHEAYLAILNHHRTAALEKLKSDLESEMGGKDCSPVAFCNTAKDISEKAMSLFDAGAADAKVSEVTWDASKIREKLKRDIDSHIASVKAEKLKFVASDAEKQLLAAFSDPVDSLLSEATEDTWPQIRTLFTAEKEKAEARLSQAIAGYELNKEDADKMKSELEAAGRAGIEKKTKAEAAYASALMKDRFTTVFGRDSNMLPRLWTGKEDLVAITMDARTSALQLLSVLAAVRLNDELPDTVGSTLHSLLGHSENNTTVSTGDSSGDSGAVLKSPTANPMAANTWPRLPAADTIITPAQCRTIWRQFMSETEFTIGQAIHAQEASRKGNSWMPPPWAILAMIILGFNEAMALARNPLTAISLALGFFLCRALWFQMDVAQDFNGGMLPGMLAVSAKLIPTFVRLFQKLVEEGQTQLEQQMSPRRRRPRPVSEIQMHDFVSERESEEESTVLRGGAEPTESARMRLRQGVSPAL